MTNKWLTDWFGDVINAKEFLHVKTYMIAAVYIKLDKRPRKVVGNG